jgi:hypothetical protein
MYSCSSLEVARSREAGPCVRKYLFDTVLNLVQLLAWLSAGTKFSYQI